MNYNGLLDTDLLQAYLDGRLDAKGMHQVEKLSLEDPFVAEALAGLSAATLRNESLSSLQKKLHQRVAEKPIETKRWTITAQRLSIGSAAAVLFITVSVLFWMKETSRKQIEANEAKNVKIEIAPKEDVATQPIPQTTVDKEIDKALADAKTNTYAGTSKPKVTLSAPVPASLAKTTVAEGNVNADAVNNISVAKEVSAERMIKKEIGQDDQALNEVVVTGMGVRKKNVSAASAATISSEAEPLVGWTKFEAYLTLNNKLVKDNQFAGKSVQLSFLIDDKNRPTAIKVLNGLTKEENDEAIRLLSNGPDWKYNLGYTAVPVKVTIKF